VNKAQHIDVEVLPPSVAGAMVKAEIDGAVAIAKQHPRNLEDFRRRAIEQATEDEEVAASCLYRRNVGKDAHTGKTVWAEGNSIRMAEIVMGAYGNLRCGAKLVSIEKEGYVVTQGFCQDLETNTTVYSEFVSPAVTKDGKPFSLRMMILTAQGGLSKSLRDAVFKMITPARCRVIEKACRKKILGENVPLEQRKKKLAAWLDKIPIDKARVFAVVGVKNIDGITEDHLVTLTGCVTAIQNGDSTLEEQFPPVVSQKPAVEQPKPKRKEAAKKKAAALLPKQPAAAPEPPPAASEPAGKDRDSEDGTVEDLRALQSFLVEHGIGLGQVQDTLNKATWLGLGTALSSREWKDLGDVSFPAARAIMKQPRLLQELIAAYAVKKEPDGEPGEGVDVPDELMV
jgi:hypothetical protein